MSAQPAEWTSADLYTSRPDVPGHALHTRSAGALFIVVCECGYESLPLHLSNVIGAENRHRLLAERGPVDHDHTRVELGDRIQVVCSCGWEGGWRWAGSPVIEKQLHSDDGVHLYAVRRGDA